MPEILARYCPEHGTYRPSFNRRDQEQNDLCPWCQGFAWRAQRDKVMEKVEALLAAQNGSALKAIIALKSDFEWRHPRWLGGEFAEDLPQALPKVTP